MRQIRRSFRHPLLKFPYNDHILSRQLNVERGFQTQNSPDSTSFFQNAMDDFGDSFIFYTDSSKSQESKSALCTSIRSANQFTHSWTINYSAYIFSIKGMGIL